MYAVAMLEPGARWLSLKCSDEEFVELVERPGIIPAPYLARAHWIALESESTVPRTELQQLLTRGHAIVLSKFPEKTQAALAARKTSKHSRSRKTPGRIRLPGGMKCASDSKEVSRRLCRRVRNGCPVEKAEKLDCASSRGNPVRRVCPATGSTRCESDSPFGLRG